MQSSVPPPRVTWRPDDGLGLADLEAVRLLLRGGSVIDWHRLNFETAPQIEHWARALEIDPADPVDRGRVEAVKARAIDYLRRNYHFPVPRPVAQADLAGLVGLASGKGHRQLCACTILKVMHIIHHLEARELLYRLPMSDEEVFHLVEEKVYRVIGGMLAQGLPILEFIGGRKNRDSMITKLLSKPETVAANVYDKLRFRVVTRAREDVFPVVGYLLRHLIPFNYVTPRESTNTLLHFRSFCEGRSDLAALLPRLQLSPDLEDGGPGAVDNRFTSPRFRTVHFVVDMPVRVPPTAALDPETVDALGRVVFAQSEFQIVDRETEQENELGDASHAAYKQRQKVAVARRLKLGLEGVGNDAGAAAAKPRPSRRPPPRRRRRSSQS